MIQRLSLEWQKILPCWSLRKLASLWKVSLIRRVSFLWCFPFTRTLGLSFDFCMSTFPYCQLSRFLPADLCGCVFGLLWRVLALFLSLSSRPGGGWSQPNAELHPEGSGKPASLCWEGASSPNIFGYKGDQGVSLAACLSEIPSPHHQGKYLICRKSFLWCGGEDLFGKLTSFWSGISCTQLGVKWFFGWPHLPPPLV